MGVAKTLDIPIEGMDCTECTLHVRQAIQELPGVQSVEVFLASEKAVVQLDPERVRLEQIRQAVESAGYHVPGSTRSRADEQEAGFTRPIWTLLGVVFFAVLFVVVVGEWLGLFEAITRRVPWPVGLALVLVAGYPVFRDVAQATLRGQIISHTLMTLGVIAAIAVGEWATAAVVVFFMRVGDYVEHFTTERARRAVKDLSAMAPQTARLEKDGVEVEVPIAQVQVGDIVVVRPGEMIPVDGEVIAGQATLNQAAITGEAMPVEAGIGARVYAATFAQLGSLRLRVTQVGADTTFGRVIRLVEQAEAHRAQVQRLADKFSAYYLPIVAGLAALTLLIRRDPLATAAVLVVACSCSFALATPIAMLASIGAAARQGLMIKGGKYLELLDRAEVLLVDKTGTLTLGKPQLVDVRLLGDNTEAQNQEDEIARLLFLAASAERYSEHPLAEATRVAAQTRGIELTSPEEFSALPGRGVRALVDGRWVEVGNRLMFAEQLANDPFSQQIADALQPQGKTLLFVAVDGKLAGILAATDTLRPEAPEALRQMQALGIREIELLTGDNAQAAQALAEVLNNPAVKVHANLLPEDKIQIVRQHQAQGQIVLMVGDGVNDAPALAQADVGIAMGAAGSDIAIEAAHVALMRDDWMLLPQALRIARRTLRVVRMNIAFTALYNLVGLSLAALGFLPPILAAAAQSLPDLGILANSSRLLRSRG
jgi:Cd2+/Zn2+-exporting ATPase/Cu+-exporting ATPase